MEALLGRELNESVDGTGLNCMFTDGTYLLFMYLHVAVLNMSARLRTAKLDGTVRAPPYIRCTIERGCSTPLQHSPLLNLGSREDMSMENMGKGFPFMIVLE